jgi:hypothetical protein
MQVVLVGGQTGWSCRVEVKHVAYAIVSRGWV